MNIKSAVAAVLLCASAQAATPDPIKDGYVYVGGSADRHAVQFFLKQGSFSHDYQSVQVLELMVVDKTEYLYVLSTTHVACSAGYGVLVSKHLNGNLVSTFDVLYDGGRNPVDLVFSILCNAAGFRVD